MEMMIFKSAEVWNAVALTALAYQLMTKVLWNGLWEPLRLRRIMAKQGIKGLPFRFLVGQLPEQGDYLTSLPEVVPRLWRASPLCHPLSPLSAHCTNRHKRTHQEKGPQLGGLWFLIKIALFTVHMQRSEIDGGE